MQEAPTGQQKDWKPKAPQQTPGAPAEERAPVGDERGHSIYQQSASAACTTSPGGGRWVGNRALGSTAARPLLCCLCVGGVAD